MADEASTPRRGGVDPKLLEILVAVTQIELAKKRTSGEPPLQ